MLESLAARTQRPRPGQLVGQCAEAVADGLLAFRHLVAGGGRGAQVVGESIDSLDPAFLGTGQLLPPRIAGAQLVQGGYERGGEVDGLVDALADRLPGPVGFGVFGERPAQIVNQGGEGDEQPVRLAAEGAVHPRQRLHQQGALERAVEVERVQRWRVEAGEHHVLDGDDLQFVLGVTQPLLDGLVLPLAADMLRHRHDVLHRAGVHDLDHTLVDGVVVPLRPERDDLVVEAGADLAGRADDERLARGTDELAHLPRAGRPVRDDLARERGQPGRRPVHGVDDDDRFLDLRPLHLVKPGRGLVGGPVEIFLTDVLGQGDLRQPRFEVDGDGRPVLDGPGQVVDVDVVGE